MRATVAEFLNDTRSMKIMTSMARLIGPKDAVDKFLDQVKDKQVKQLFKDAQADDQSRSTQLKKLLMDKMEAHELQKLDKAMDTSKKIGRGLENVKYATVVAVIIGAAAAAVIQGGVAVATVAIVLAGLSHVCGGFVTWKFFNDGGMKATSTDHISEQIKQLADKIDSMNPTGQAGGDATGNLSKVDQRLSDIEEQLAKLETMLKQKVVVGL